MKEAGKKKGGGRSKSTKPRPGSSRLRGQEHKDSQSIKTLLQAGDQGSAGCEGTQASAHNRPAHRWLPTASRRSTRVVPKTCSQGGTLPESRPQLQPACAFSLVPGTISRHRQPGKPCGRRIQERSILASLLPSLLASLQRDGERSRPWLCGDGGTGGRGVMTGRGAAQGRDSIFSHRRYLPSELQGRALAKLSQHLTRQGTL